MHRSSACQFATTIPVNWKANTSEISSEQRNFIYFYFKTHWRARICSYRYIIMVNDIISCTPASPCSCIVFLHACYTVTSHFHVLQFSVHRSVCMNIRWKTDTVFHVRTNDVLPVLEIPNANIFFCLKLQRNNSAEDIEGLGWTGSRLSFSGISRNVKLHARTTFLRGNGKKTVYV